MKTIRGKPESKRTEEETKTITALYEEVKIDNAQFAAARAKDIPEPEVTMYADEMQVRAKWAAAARLKYIKDTGKEPTAQQGSEY
jgi:hypothetical protein